MPGYEPKFQEPLVPQDTTSPRAQDTTSSRNLRYNLDIEDVIAENLPPKKCGHQRASLFSRASARTDGIRKTLQSLLLDDTSFSSSSSSSLRSCQKNLHLWLRWLPIEMAVLILFVTPPFIDYSHHAVRDDGDLEAKKIIPESVFYTCAMSHLMYLLLRVFASSGVARVKELLFLLFWGLWMICYEIKRYRLIPLNISNEVGFILCLGMISVYVLRFAMVVIAIRRISRTLVSKKKKRFVDASKGIDLDLTYITKRVIGMGFPSENFMEAQLRNRMEDVQRFFAKRHAGNYKVYNLCIERGYSQKCFEKEFHDVRFPDHNPCPLADLRVICEDMQAFLDRRHRVVAIHCKAGKGRTGLVISAFLLHSRRFSTADDALQHFGNRRTFNGKGVTIPSQIRYVHHYEQIVREGGMRPPVWLRLCRLEAVPYLLENCHFQIVTHEDGCIFDSLRAQISGQQAPHLLEGDVKIVVFHAKVKLFHFWLHTAYDPYVYSECSADVPPAMGMQIWEDKERPISSPCRTCVFPRMHLDGLHKEKNDAKGKKLAKLLHPDLEVHIIFDTPSPEHQHEESCNRERQRAQARIERSRVKSLRAVRPVISICNSKSFEKDTDSRLTCEPHSAIRKSARSPTRDASPPPGRSARSPPMGLTHSRSGSPPRVGLTHSRSGSPPRSPTNPTKSKLAMPPNFDVAILSDAEDYDAMNNDTDEEEMLSTLYRGYMVRKKGCCSARVRRWCEFSTSGQLHIAGADVLVVDVLEGESVCCRLPDTRSDGCAWRVKNPRTGSWEILEAEEGEEKHWNQAFADCLHLGASLADADTAFCTFFWKLNHDVDESQLGNGFEFADWRVRLFVLRSSGEFVLYSWKHRQEKMVADLASSNSRVEQMGFCWRSMPHAVPFQILTKDKPPKTFAAKEEDFHALVATVARMRSVLHIGSDISFTI